MKKTELKKIIKECVKEILFEEGVLSNLVAEVAFGITKAQNQLMVESSEAKNEEALILKKAEAEERKRKNLLETKRKMLDAIGNDRMSGIFEGTKPLAEPSKASPHSPLSGQDPNDAGVDISGLFGLAGKKWQQLK
jgi:translation elongation factor EF-1beta